MGSCPLLSSTLTLQELSRCALWLSARDHQGSKDPEEKSQHNKQTKKTDRQTGKKKKTGTECILIWENGSWLTTANVNALSSLPTHESLLFSKSPLQAASWGVSPGLLRGSTRGLFRQVQHSGLVLPGPCPAEIMYRLLGLRPVLKGSRPHNTALWLPPAGHRLRAVPPQDKDRVLSHSRCSEASKAKAHCRPEITGNGSSQAAAAAAPPNIFFCDGSLGQACLFQIAWRHFVQTSQLLRKST